jgi:signal transduction histidine kinase
VLRKQILFHEKDLFFYYIWSMRKSCIIFLFLIGNFHLIAQSNRGLDSIANLIRNQPNETRQLWFLRTYYDVLSHYFHNHPNESYLQLAELLQDKTTPSIVPARILALYAWDLIENKKVEESKPIVNKIEKLVANNSCYQIDAKMIWLRYYEANKDFAKMDSLFQLFTDLGERNACYQQLVFLLERQSEVERVKGNFLKSHNLLLKGVQYTEKYRLDMLFASFLYRSLGTRNYEMDNDEQALVYWNKGLQVLLDSNIVTRQSIALYNNIGLVHRRKEEYDQALEYLQKAYKGAINQKDTAWIGITSGNIGQVYFHKKAYQKALPLLRIGVDYSIKTQQWGNVITEMTMLANCQIKLQNYFHAKQEIDSIKYFIWNSHLLPYANFDSTTNNLRYRYHRVLSEWFSAQQQVKEAIEEQRLYIYFFEKHQRERNANIFAKFQAEFDVAQKEKTIELLQSEAKITEKETQRQRVLAYSFFIALIIMLLWGVSLFYGRRKEQRAKQILAKRNEEINQQREEVAVQAEQLNQLNALKDKLFSIIAHDLRSPLNSLKGALQVQNLKLFTPEQQQSINESIANQLTSIDTTLENLLHWAKIQMAEAKTELREFPIFYVAEESISFLQEVAIKKGIEIENLIDAEFRVRADINQVRTILRNLIANAIKFSKENGSILINAEVYRNDAVPEAISYTNPKNNRSLMGKFNQEMLLIAITDYGIGMSTERLQQLFNKTSHISTRGTAGERGTGLGLLLCKEFVENNGGQIWVSSKEGKGSTFYFTLLLSD